MPERLLLTNAKLALPNRIAEGWIALADGMIEECGEGPGPSGGSDMAGDLVMPGLIELHTDHLEAHLSPRPKVRWPALSALLAFDAQIAAAGITTVYDCIRAGDDADNRVVQEELHEVLSTIESAQADGLLRAAHRVHLRCEICADNVVSQMASVMERHRLDLISLMDHTPGARQFTSLDAWRTYYGGKTGKSAAELDALIELKRQQFSRNYSAHRQELVALARQSGVVVASHDDATSGHVDESKADGIGLAEFPTTVEAARLSLEAGIQVMMGAPNVVRGGSHSGNVAAEELARAGYLDILSSDYVPGSLLFAAFGLAQRLSDWDLPRALCLVTKNPADAAGLTDRGEITAGKRADLVRVHVHNGQPVIREVYREGRRVT